MEHYKDLINTDSINFVQNIHTHFLKILRNIFVDDKIISTYAFNHSFIPDYVISTTTEEIHFFTRYSSKYVAETVGDLNFLYRKKRGKDNVKLIIILLKGDDLSEDTFPDDDTLVVSAECLEQIDRIIYEGESDIAKFISSKLKSSKGYLNTKQLDIWLQEIGGSPKWMRIDVCFEH